MKIGMIFECSQVGADGKVYPYLAKQIRPDIHIRSIFHDRKPILIERCGKTAKNLLEIDKCEHVIIIWDLRPGHTETNLCPVEDCNRIRDSLNMAQLTPAQLQKIHLICIEQELETIFLFDVRALSKFLESISGHPCKVKRVSHPEYHPNPKHVLYKIFEEQNCRKYEDLKDAEKIMKFLTISRLKRCPAFKRFERIVKNL